MLYVVAGLFALLSGVCVLSILVGIPGSWIMIGLAVIIELADGIYLPPERRVTFGLWLIVACVALAALGEVLEFIAGMIGAKRAGSSNRGMWGALIGGIGGAILGIGIPVPVVGSLIGAVIGTFVGAVIGELSAPDKTVRGSIKPATGATIGRILGTLSKLPIAMAIWLFLVIAAFWP